MQKLATEEFITQKVFITTAESQNLTLNFSMFIISFYNTVQSLWIQSQEILISGIYLPTLKSVYTKTILARGLKFKI